MEATSMANQGELVKEISTKIPQCGPKMKCYVTLKMIMHCSVNRYGKLSVMYFQLKLKVGYATTSSILSHLG